MSGGFCGDGRAPPGHSTPGTQGRARIVMPENSTKAKVEAARGYGAEIVFRGPRQRGLLSGTSIAVRGISPATLLIETPTTPSAPSGTASSTPGPRGPRSPTAFGPA